MANSVNDLDRVIILNVGLSASCFSISMTPRGYTISISNVFDVKRGPFAYVSPPFFFLSVAKMVQNAVFGRKSAIITRCRKFALTLNTLES